MQGGSAEAESTLTKECFETWKSWEITFDPLPEDNGGKNQEQ